MHGIKLPRDYKNWLMLSNGLEFADKIVYKLDELDLENPVTGPKDGKDLNTWKTNSYGILLQ